MELTAAFVIGLLGSLHCIGMCGPLALAVPIRTKSSTIRFVSALIYNSGRVLTYMIIGALFGALGYGFYMAGFQRYLTIGLGIALILYVVVYYTSSKDFLSYTDRLPIVIWVRKKLSSLLSRNKMSNLFIVGLLNGLLPCGLVYMAVAGAIASGSVIEGSLFMGLFGLGTLPAMVLLMMLGNFIGVSVRNKIRRSIPVVLLLLGALFFIRGLNLGIPYLSPKISYEMSTSAGCH